MGELNEREELIKRATGLREEITQIFEDTKHWNDNVRTRFEKPIDPDPDGKLTVMAKNIDKFIVELN